MTNRSEFFQNPEPEEWTGKDWYTEAPDFSGLDPETGKGWSPIKIVKILGLTLVDNEFTKTACEKVVKNNIKQATDYKTGKKNLIGFFIKSVLDETNKQADPKIIKEILENLLNDKQS